ncbi:MAG: hypothetical protein ACRD5J_08550 [Nitrososphaeraceae archaeon]
MSTQKKEYKYRIEQTSRGAKVTVYGNAIDEIVTDYATQIEAGV